MKKILFRILFLGALLMCLTTVGCSSDDDTEDTSTTEKPVAAENETDGTPDSAPNDSAGGQTAQTASKIDFDGDIAYIFFGENIEKYDLDFLEYSEDLKFDDARNSDVNFNGETVRYIEPNQFLYFFLTGDFPLRKYRELVFEITYYDVGTSVSALELGRFIPPDTVMGHYDNKIALRTSGTDTLKTAVIPVMEAMMMRGQRYDADVRIAAGEDGFFLKSIVIKEGQIMHPDDYEKPEFAGQTDTNNLLGKAVSGYQMWFTASPDQTSGWVHWNGWSAPAPGRISFENWPDVREYSDDVLEQTLFDDLGNGEPAMLFSSKNAEVVDLHFSWISEYGIDGLAVQRFYGETIDKPTFEDNHINLVQRAAEKYDKLFYVMYDFSGAASAGDDAIDRVKGDWVYSIEQKGLVSSPNYAYVNGKPVVCLWGLAGNDPDRYPSAHVALTLVKWFQERGYFVIGGCPDNGWASVRDDYAEVYQSLDMVSPWTVGRYKGREVAPWWRDRLNRELEFCETYDIIYQPVIFPGFAWSNFNGGPANDFPRASGQFLWDQAVYLQEQGMQCVYIAMFDEYDEGTAIMKGAEDSSMIPQGEQFFYTFAMDGKWLSSDFYLRLAGEISRLFKGEIEPSDEVPVVHSNGPVYFRNGFERREYINLTTNAASIANVDVCVPDPYFIKFENTAQNEFEMTKTGGSSGIYSLSFTGVAGTDSPANDSFFYLRIAETAILVPENLQLSYMLQANNELGQHVFVDLQFDDGTLLSDSPDFDGKLAKGQTGDWHKVTHNLDTFAGKTITAVIVAYDNIGTGEYSANIDDIIIEIR